MLSNVQVFKPCEKSCKPNRPISVAKRYSTKSTLYFQWQVYCNNCLCSLVSNPDQFTLLIMAGCCECATADNNIQGHGVTVFGRQ